MTDERDRSGYPNQPYAGEPERGEGGMREGNPRDPNGREPQHQRPGFGDQDQQGVHRGPRRSRYGRRRMPGDGPSSGPNDFAAGEHRDQRGPRLAEDDVDNYLPSFIAGSSGAPDPFANANSAPAPSHTPAYNPGHGAGHSPPSPQGYQGHGRDQGQVRDQGPPREHGGYQGPPREHGGYQGQPREHGGYQGPAREHGGYQGGYAGGGQQAPHHAEPPMMNQAIQQPEEPSPEVQAAAAEFAEWEASNPKLRGLLVCNPTYKRGEPVVRGTRIPARILAAIAKMGSSVEEMLQDYPALSREGLDAALAFAAAHPRQSR
ncbi:MAG TPA: DUF433 domain-containing protein [Candidatus Sulfotelmatobacter sp.]|nr:DUF433 domain-containing protein [Candidatus Sulfotelmatobacter sp.]